jgi:hypothetical protein
LPPLPPPPQPIRTWQKATPVADTAAVREGNGERRRRRRRERRVVGRSNVDGGVGINGGGGSYRCR